MVNPNQLVDLHTNDPQNRSFDDGARQGHGGIVGGHFAKVFGDGDAWKLTSWGPETWGENGHGIFVTPGVFREHQRLLLEW